MISALLVAAGLAVAVLAVPVVVWLVGRSFVG